MSKLFKRAYWARYSRLVHLTFAWVGGIALLMWGLSGITHPIMSWTGPEQARFFPPRLAADLGATVSVADILRKAGIAEAVHVRVQPSFDGAVLQVSEKAGEPRRYFAMKTGVELADRDRQHAIWLARYYTGLKDAPVASATLQTTFDNDYPWVNRLLPVWRIEFASPDQRRAYIYTELNALGAQHNGMRHVWQTVFMALHNWTWLDRFDGARVILIGIFMLGLLGMLTTGIAMVLSFKPRPIGEPSRRWHRRLAYAIWLPIFLFTTSGTYHLLQYHLGGNTRGKQEGRPMDLRGLWSAPQDSWRSALADRAASSVSVIEGPQGLLVRIERLPAGQPVTGPQAPAGAAASSGSHDHHAPVTRAQRFEGRPTTGEIVYFDAATGAPSPIDDEAMARHLAVRLGGARPEEIVAVEKLTRFGLGYDFRNKRLPIWQVTLADGPGRTLFIDSSANLLVDQLTRYERWETWSFSILHKWNFLRPFGAAVMDGVVVTCVLSSCLGAVLGLRMLIAGRRRQGAVGAQPATRPSRIREGAA